MVGVQVGLRQFQNSDFDWFKSAAANSGYSRYALTQELCTTRTGWHNNIGIFSGILVDAASFPDLVGAGLIGRALKVATDETSESSN